MLVHEKSTHLPSPYRFAVPFVMATFLVSACGTGTRSMGAKSSSFVLEASQSDDSSQSDGSSENSADGSSDDSEQISLISSIVAAGLLIGLSVTLTMKTTKDDAVPARQALARRYLKRNRRTLRIALSRGDGAFFDDLAHLLELTKPQHALLKQTLNSNRETLDAFLADEDITLDEAGGFCVAFVDAINRQAELEQALAKSSDRLIKIAETEMAALLPEAS